MKVLVTRRMTAAAEDALHARFDADIREDAAALTVAEAAQALRDYDAIMPTLGDAFTAAAFEAAGTPRCKLLANFGAGFNHIDLAAATAAGVTVTNTPDAVTEATADIAMTLILMTARRASEGERILRRGEWTGWQPTQLLGSHVSGKTLGVIGMGRIGKAIAARAHFGFGMEVVFFNRSQVTSLDMPATQLSSVHDVLRSADFIVLAVPGGARTHHLIGAKELHDIGPRSYLINISRGDVIDEVALIEALQKHQIAGAGLDVYEREPEVPQALRDLDNVTLLPHLGTATEETRTAMALRAIANLTTFAEGGVPKDRVN